MYTTNTHWSPLILVSQQYSKARTEYNGTIHDESGAGVHVASIQTRSSKLNLVFTGWLGATTRCSLDTVCDAPSILFVLPVTPLSPMPPPVFPLPPPVFPVSPPMSPSPPVFPTLPGPHGECQDEGSHTNRVLLQHTLPPSTVPRLGTMASCTTAFNHLFSYSTATPHWEGTQWRDNWQWSISSTSDIHGILMVSTIMVTDKLSW